MTIDRNNFRPSRGARAPAAAKRGTSRNSHKGGSQTGPVSGRTPAATQSIQSHGATAEPTTRGSTLDLPRRRRVGRAGHPHLGQQPHHMAPTPPPQTHPSRGHNSNRTRRHRTPQPGHRHRVAATGNQQKRRLHKAVRTRLRARRQKARSRKKQWLPESSNSQPVSA